MLSSTGRRCDRCRDKDAQLLAEAFNIKTVRQLGGTKLFAVAVALAALEDAG